MIGFHPPVWAVRNDPPICAVGPDRWSGSRARHRPCLPKPLQLTNKAQVRVHRRNGVVAAKMEDETRSDHRPLILLQIQEPPAVAGCLRIPISDLLAALSSTMNLKAPMLAPVHTTSESYCGGKEPADPTDDPQISVSSA